MVYVHHNNNVVSVALGRDDGKSHWKTVSRRRRAGRYSTDYARVFACFVTIISLRYGFPTACAVRKKKKQRVYLNKNTRRQFFDWISHDVAPCSLSPSLLQPINLPQLLLLSRTRAKSRPPKYFLATTRRTPRVSRALFGRTGRPGVADERVFTRRRGRLPYTTFVCECAVC